MVLLRSCTLNIGFWMDFYNKKKKKIDKFWQIWLYTCVADSLLELFWLFGPGDFNIIWAPAVSPICFKYSISLNTFLSPPPGRCFTLSKEPTLLCTFKSILRFSIWKFLAKMVKIKKNVQIHPDTEFISDSYEIVLWIQLSPNFS